MKKIKVAIVLSSYNGEKYIEEQVLSIYKQKFNGTITLFIRDDGSSDKTMQIIKNIKLNDGFLIVIPGVNIGSTMSFFSLLDYVKKYEAYFDYFGFADQDDVWDKDKIQVAVDYLERENKLLPCMYGCASRNVDSNLKYWGIDAIDDRKLSFFNTIIQNRIAGHTQVFNKAMFDLIMKDFKADKIYVHDSYLTNIAIICGKIIYDSKPHVSYRQHEHNQLGTSNKNSIAWLLSRIKRIENGENKKYANQIAYITEKFSCCLNKEQYDEMKLFFECQNNIFKRFKYIMVSKLYRKNIFETIAFKILYLIGGYNI